MKVYLVVYNHSYFKAIDATVFSSSQKAEEYKRKEEQENECVFASWEIIEKEVQE